MDKVPLNNSPDLTMAEITKLLFNNEFMSDIQFHVGGKVMYAHSWEVMKRSTVFWQQFRTNLGENKLIPIADVSYEAFYQFLKYIYTDKCEIDDHLLCDMLKLAVRYKIVKLETRLLNVKHEKTTSIGNELKLFEFGVLNQYQLCIADGLDFIRSYLNPNHTNTGSFLNIDETALEQILKSDIQFNCMSENDLFEALVLWMNNLCERNQKSLGQRRLHFDKLIRLIRFPVIADEYPFRLIFQQHRDLLTDDDFGSIMKASLGSTDKNCMWNNKPRSKYQVPWISELPMCSEKLHLTKFRVVDDVILSGVRYFNSFSTHNVNITWRNLTTNLTNTIQFENTCIVHPCKMSFGDSIRLIPNYEYSIQTTVPISIDYQFQNYVISSRNPKINAIVTGPTEMVKIIDTGDYLSEIIFKSPSE